MIPFLTIFARNSANVSRRTLADSRVLIPVLSLSFEFVFLFMCFFLNLRVFRRLYRLLSLTWAEPGSREVRAESKGRDRVLSGSGPWRGLCALTERSESGDLAERESKR